MQTGVSNKNDSLTRCLVGIGTIRKGKKCIGSVSFGEKYKLDFEYSERDRQLFNRGEKDKLYTVYEKGQVALIVTRKKKKYSRELWLYIEYRDVEPAQEFFKSAKPKRAKKSDF